MWDSEVNPSSTQTQHGTESTLENTDEIEHIRVV